MREAELDGERDRALLVGVPFDGQGVGEAEESIAELKKLTETAGAQVIHQVIQPAQRPNSRTLMGSGKVEEISLLCRESGIDMVILDEKLTPAQQRNLEGDLDVPVIDRPQLILDIFAQRARSNEGKLQVELAQLKYLLPRLTGKGLLMSRLGGGIGTRGPGETQLEVDRRKVRRRIHKLEGELEAVKKRRRVQRAGRKSLQLPSVALVGYTNAGKSTLFNALTDACVPTEDKLFATLDPTIRKLSLPDGGDAVISDTVGFIRKLPHELVAAFKATLEEVVEADLLIHVIDAANERWEEQVSAVRRVLEEIGAIRKPSIEALNKTDLLKDRREVSRLLFRCENGIPVSARYGKGLDDLLKAVQGKLQPVVRHLRCAVPYHRGDLISLLHEKGKVLYKEYRQDNVLIEVDIEHRFSRALEQYEVA